MILKILIEKLQEMFQSVAPVSLLVLILHLTIVPLPGLMLGRFFIGAILIMIGLALFLFGVELGITPIGQYLGKTLASKNKLILIIIGGSVLGFLISIAEPDLQILAKQIDEVTSGAINSTTLIVAVSIGIGIMITVGLLRIVFNWALNRILTVSYGLILILSIFASNDVFAISFDSSGATTGALTVPFILALAGGVASMKKNGKSSEEDNFGLVGIASVGAIIAVLLLGIITKPQIVDAQEEILLVAEGHLLQPFLYEFPHILKEVLIAVSPILVIFLVFHFFIKPVKKDQLQDIFKGLAYLLVGLILFLVGVNAGFMDVGKQIGHDLYGVGNYGLIIAISLLLGVLVILAEPAVYVLTHQIEDVTGGSIKRTWVLVTLCIGVGLAVALSTLRILVPDIQLWHYLLPGFLISILLSYKVPSLFVGMAFDAGGVASGPMTATFILAFIQGLAHGVPTANVLTDGFGMIAMVAMMPILSLQLLGLIYTARSKRSITEVERR